ncbi:MAG: hypothetical protein ACRD0G_06725 [Acidimicrobiales bacterium]
MVTGLTAAADHVGRFGGGALLTATVLPTLLRPDVLRRDRQVVDF